MHKFEGYKRATGVCTGRWRYPDDVNGLGGSNMAYQFLSDEWMVAARESRAQYQDDSIKIPVGVRMNQIITGVPFGEGTVATYTDTTSGSLDIDLGHLETADVTVTTDYMTARNIFVEQDPNFTMQAFMSGKIKVEGDMLKMMALQAAMPQDEIAKTIADEIKSITK